MFCGWSILFTQSSRACSVQTDHPYIIQGYKVASEHAKNSAAAFTHALIVVPLMWVHQIIVLVICNTQSTGTNSTQAHAFLSSTSQQVDEDLQVNMSCNLLTYYLPSHLNKQYLHAPTANTVTLHKTVINFSSTLTVV